MKDALIAAVADALARLADRGLLPPDVLAAVGGVHLERPRVAEHGDWSTNIALTLAKQAGKKPRDLAESIVAELSLPRGVERATVEGPGFINFWLRVEAWGSVAASVVGSGESFGRLNANSESVNLEFVSANPTGPMHLGHARWAAWGDALARLLDARGSKVTREFYLNDAGNQLELLGQSLAARYLEICGRPSGFPEEGYRGAYLRELAEELRAEVGESWVDRPDLDQACGEWGCDRLAAQIRAQLDRLGVTFDVWFSEREMRESGGVGSALERLAERGVIYEDEGATWLRSTSFGDDKDRVLIKSDGSFTYLAGDIAYHIDKFDRGFDRLIDLWGADHGGHVPKMRAALEALGCPVDRFEVILGQLVSLNRHGEPVTMSKRSGEVYTYEELVDEIGPDAARFHFLMQGPDTALNLDVEEAVSQSMENPVFYVQYAHARIRSIQRKAAEAGVLRSETPPDLGLLLEAEEIALLKKLDEYPDLVAEAAERRAPQRITQWARELAGALHSFYAKHRVLGGPDELVQPRLWLIEACRIGLQSALSILGVTAPEVMSRLEEEEEPVGA